MNQNDNPLDPRERRALRECVGENSGPRKSGSEVDDIIRLAIVSASRMLRSPSRKADVALAGKNRRATPAFEQRIVALFGD